MSVLQQNLIGFDAWPQTRLVYGVNSVDRVGELAAEITGGRVLLVTDPGIERACHADRVRDRLVKAGLEVVVFDGVIENPTTREVDACVAAARAAEVTLIIGLGGGSSMDTAKGCNFLLTNGGRMRDYWGVGKATRPMLPLIAIPTTAGTGSECQSFALIADEATHQKMACGDRKAAARVAILDPTLTLTQPNEVTAHTGMDAIAHAVESAVTAKRNEISSLYARESFRLTATHFPRVLSDPGNLDARGGMQLGAALAGMAIENSMLGAAHAMANPLTARFDVAHGQAVGMALPAVVRFNGESPEVTALYADLASAAGLIEPGVNGQDAVDAVASTIESLMDQARMPRRLAELGVTREALGDLAAEAEKQWTGTFNPRPVKTPEFEALYGSVM